jgi:endonuclease YncB( thermonuclease family)
MPAVCLTIALLAGPARAEGEVPAGGIEAHPCGGAHRLDRLRDVGAGGDLALESGVTIRLVGIRLPQDGPLRESALAWLREQAGRKVRVEEASGPDRWGRVPARLMTDEGPDEGSADPGLGEALVGQGLALVDPAATETMCGPDLLPIEARARERGLGVWANDRYKAVAATQTERLRERIGHFVLVEGRIRTVGERRQRTYLNFGPDWASDFTIIIPKRIWSAMLRRGFTAATLERRNVRARGILEDWQGPALTVTLPEAIEFLDAHR